MNQSQESADDQSERLRKASTLNQQIATEILERSRSRNANNTKSIHIESKKPPGYIQYSTPLEDVIPPSEMYITSPLAHKLHGAKDELLRATANMKYASSLQTRTEDAYEVREREDGSDSIIIDSLPSSVPGTESCTESGIMTAFPSEQRQRPDPTEDYQAINGVITQKAVALLEEEKERRCHLRKISESEDDEIRRQSEEFASSLDEQHRETTREMELERDNMAYEDMERRKENIQRAITMQEQERQRQMELLTPRESVIIIDYDLLNHYHEIEVLSQITKCRDYNLKIAIRCRKLAEQQRSCKLLDLYNQRMDRLSKRKMSVSESREQSCQPIKGKTDWKLYIDCKMLQNPKRRRMLRELHERWGVVRLTQKKQVKESSTQIKLFIEENSNPNSSSNRERRRRPSSVSGSSTTISSKKAKYTKYQRQRSPREISAFNNHHNRMQPKLTFTFKPVIDSKPKAVFRPNRSGFSRKRTLTKRTKMTKPRSRSQGTSCLHSTKSNESNSNKPKILTVDTNTRNNRNKIPFSILNDIVTDIDVTEFISPIDKFIGLSNGVVEKCESDVITSSIDESAAFNVSLPRKTKLTKETLDRLSQPKKRHIPSSNATDSTLEWQSIGGAKFKGNKQQQMRSSSLGAPRVQTENKKNKLKKRARGIDAKLSNSAVFEKLYTDHEEICRRKRVAKGLYDSAISDKIKEQCSFTPEITQSQSKCDMRRGTAPWPQRVEEFQKRKQRNLQRLIESDPVRARCTFQPNTNVPKSQYDYSVR